MVMEVQTLSRSIVSKILDIMDTPLSLEWTVYHAGKKGEAVSTIYSKRYPTKEGVLKFFPEGGVNTSVEVQWYGRTKIKNKWSGYEHIINDDISYSARLTAYNFTIVFYDVDFSGEEEPVKAKQKVEQLKKKLTALKGCATTLTFGG